MLRWALQTTSQPPSVMRKYGTKCWPTGVSGNATGISRVAFTRDPSLPSLPHSCCLKLTVMAGAFAALLATRSQATRGVAVL